MTLPNFLLIGAGKSGTTSLWRYLEQHPEVYMSPIKGPNFFAFEGREPDFRGPPPEHRHRHFSKLGSVRNRPSPLAFSNGFVAFILRRKQRSLRI